MRYVDSMAYTIGGSVDNAATYAKYSNHIQAVSESIGLGLPFILSCDPSSILMGYTSQQVQAGAIMLTYSIPWDDDGSLGDKRAGALNSYITETAAAYGFEGLVATDAIGVSQYDYDGSYEGATAPEMAANMFMAGEIEPKGLLLLQTPADMDTVEAQCEDVPRDMECYVDSDGNTYDFAFGMNWSGVINDERVATYQIAPMTAPAAASK